MGASVEISSGGEPPKSEKTEKHTSGGKLPNCKRPASGGKPPKSEKTEKHATGGELLNCERPASKAKRRKSMPPAANC